MEAGRRLEVGSGLYSRVHVVLVIQLLQISYHKLPLLSGKLILLRFCFCRSLLNDKFNIRRQFPVLYQLLLYSPDAGHSKNSNALTMVKYPKCNYLCERFLLLTPLIFSLCAPGVHG